MKEIYTTLIAITMAEEPDSSKFPTPEHVLNTHPTYSVVAMDDIKKKKKKKGKKLSEKGKKKKKGFWSKVFGAK